MLRNYHIEDTDLEQILEVDESMEDECEKQVKRSLLNFKDLVPDEFMDYLRLIYKNKDNRNYQITSVYHPTILVNGQEILKEEFVKGVIQQVSQTMLKHVEQLFLDLPKDLKSELELLADKGLDSSTVDPRYFPNILAATGVDMESTDPRYLHKLMATQTQILVTMNLCSLMN